MKINNIISSSDNFINVLIYRSIKEIYNIGFNETPPTSESAIGVWHIKHK